MSVIILSKRLIDSDLPVQGSQGSDFKIFSGTHATFSTVDMLLEFVCKA